MVEFILLPLIPIQYYSLLSLFLLFHNYTFLCHSEDAGFQGHQSIIDLLSPKHTQNSFGIVTPISLQKID